MREKKKQTKKKHTKETEPNQQKYTKTTPHISQEKKGVTPNEFGSLGFFHF